MTLLEFFLTCFRSFPQAIYSLDLVFQRYHSTTFLVFSSMSLALIHPPCNLRTVYLISSLGKGYRPYKEILSSLSIFLTKTFLADSNFLYLFSCIDQIEIYCSSLLRPSFLMIMVFLPRNEPCFYTQHISISLYFLFFSKFIFPRCSLGMSIVCHQGP